MSLVGQPCHPWVAVTHVVGQTKRTILPTVVSCKGRAGHVLAQSSCRFWLRFGLGRQDCRQHVDLCVYSHQWTDSELTELFSESTAWCGTRDLFLYLIISAEKLCIYQISG